METIPRVIFSQPIGYKIEELRKGNPEGKKAFSGARVSILYTGSLQETGTIFADFTGTPVELILGSGEILHAVEVGVAGIVGVADMLVGDRRKITVPPRMGYDKRGYGELVPPNACLIFEVELVDAWDEIPLWEPIDTAPRPKNGFTFEVLVNGLPDSKIAVSGRQVRIRYTGSLLKTGDVFDNKFSIKPRKYLVLVQCVWDSVLAFMGCMLVRKGRSRFLPYTGMATWVRLQSFLLMLGLFIKWNLLMLNRLVMLTFRLRPD
ncbi:PREDICTED: peptidyl-prolyl cis-trans isomerase FKBP10-like [Brassica oleracea var. oleracea]|uniref:peptidyl-prolyl cis-trans isomerase FKBP10-like n=1 Tax=Brassica oleracea var. oleracea TaxID=109376 RepID=UPI0006A7437F|nr:PREDICTED: peptidyl-prolyl cis-trans isomerase FKBP10-like [Brassica oleracea var. oleracea]